MIDVAYLEKLKGLGVPVEQLKNMFDKLNTVKQKRDAREAVYTARKVAESAEKNVYVSEEKLHTLDSSEPNPETILESTSEIKAEKIVDIGIQKSDKSFEDIEHILNDYKAVKIYYDNIDKFLKMEEDENKKLKDELEKDLTITETNDRKVIYEKYSSEGLEDNRKIMLYVYYVVLGIYIIFGSFIKEKEYKNVAVWFFIIFYIALPFIINEITGRIIYAYKYVIYIVTNKLPKNVYTDL